MTLKINIVHILGMVKTRSILKDKSKLMGMRWWWWKAGRISRRKRGYGIPSVGREGYIQEPSETDVIAVERITRTCPSSKQG